MADMSLEGEGLEKCHVFEVLLTALFNLLTALLKVS